MRQLTLFCLILNLSSSTIDSDVVVQVSDYAINTLGYNSDSVQSVFNALNQSWNFPTSPLPELDTLGNNLYAQGSISSQANSYLQAIDSIADQSLNEDSPDELDYESFADNLISLENQIKNDNALTVNEKQTLLSACAIGRYSAAYWGNYLNDNISPMISQQPLFLKHLFKKKWFKIVTHDIGGALAGIIKGGAAAIILGGISASLLAV